MRLMSMRTGGLASRSFISGSRLWPPARTLASSLSLSRPTASPTDWTAAYLNEAGIMAPPAAFSDAAPERGRYRRPSGVVKDFVRMQPCLHAHGPGQLQDA